MTTKLIEVRDAGTFIPCLAIYVSGSSGPLARRAGYGDPCVLFGRLEGGPFHHDPHDWTTSARTMPVAHKYVAEHFDELKDGAVVDVEWILGITGTPKPSECV